MNDIRDIEIRSRGIARVVEAWKRDYDEVRQVWAIEDLIEVAQPVITDALGLYGRFVSEGAFPDPSARFSYFVHILECLAFVARETEALSSAREVCGYSVRGIDQLRTSKQQIEEIIMEDRFATDAAFSPGGAFSSWD